MSDPENAWAPQVIGGAGMVGAAIGIVIALGIMAPRNRSESGARASCRDAREDTVDVGQGRGLRDSERQDSLGSLRGRRSSRSMVRPWWRLSWSSAAKLLATPVVLYVLVRGVIQRNVALIMSGVVPLVWQGVVWLRGRYRRRKPATGE